MTILTVGTGQEFGTITAAVAAARTGDTINVQAGTYTNDFPALINGLTIQGVGGIAKLVATSQPSNGKAYLDVAGNTTLRNLDISGVTVPDTNGAAVRYESGNLTIQNSILHGNQNGILGAGDINGTITIDGSELYGNGTSAGNTHNIYIGDIATFTLKNSYIHDANTGHEVKSRAETNIIQNNRIEDGSSSASYQIDLPNGGNATITGNVIQKSIYSGNPVSIAYGEEGSAHAGHTVSIADNTFVSDQARSYVLWNTTNAAVSASGNSIYGYSQIDKAGNVSSSGFTALGSRPTLDTSSPINGTGGSSTPTPVPTPTPTPTPTPAPADTTPPTLSVAQTLSGISNRTAETITGIVTDSGTGVAKVEIYDTTGGRTVDLGAATLANGAYTFTAANLANGTHAFAAIATDKAGNATKAISAGAALTVDTVLPTLTATQSVSGASTKTSNVLSGTATDAGTGIARVEVYDTTGGRTVDLGRATLNGSAWSFTANGLATGTHAFSAIATDNAGNASASVSTGAAETVTVATSNPPPTSTPVSPAILSASLAGTGAVLIKGTAQANSKITLDYTTDGYDRAVATGTTASDGSWAITATTVDSRAINSFAVSATSGSTTTAGSSSLTLASSYSDPLFGTAGKTDVFAFAPNSGRDVISGFDATSANRDVIDLAGTDYHSFTQLQAKISGGSSAVISLTGSDTIIVAGVNPNSLTAANFRFS